MLEKKLLTLACALGILACGACFLPPLPEHRPPAPPPPIASLGVNNICVSVTNRSDAPHIDPAVFAGRVIVNINRRSPAGAPRARFCGGASPDATLQISIAGESVALEQSNPPSANLRYTFHLRIDATLVTPDGAVLWTDSRPDYQSNTLTLPGSANPWKSPGFDAWVHHQVCDRLVSRMLFDVP